MSDHNFRSYKFIGSYEPTIVFYQNVISNQLIFKSWTTWEADRAILYLLCAWFCRFTWKKRNCCKICM